METDLLAFGYSDTIAVDGSRVRLIASTETEPMQCVNFHGCTREDPTPP